MKEFKFWLEETPEVKNPYAKKFASMGDGIEFQLVQDWFPVFYSSGASPRKEIIKWWKLVYPERTSNDKNYTKLCNSISWWEKHTDFSQFDERKHYQKTVTVKRPQLT